MPIELIFLSGPSLMISKAFELSTCGSKNNFKL
jgi:hypothetical protein